MRIAIIAPPWVPVPPPAYGGTEAVLDVLARGLAEAGHDVLLYATGDSTCPVTIEWTFEHALGTDQASPVAEARQVIDAYEMARAWGADVVHDHTLFGPLYAERFDDLAVVTTNHGPFDAELTPVYRAMATGVPLIAISHHQASTAAGVPVRAVIHHGIHVSQIPTGDGAGGYALFLGRMNPNKGVHTAIEVARAAGVPLRIAAKMHEPAERAYFAERVAPLLGGDVEYVGEVGGADKYRLLADARCLLNPIAWPEPFGLVMIEALACATPVVATPCGSVPEIVDHGVTGLIAADVAGLAAALGRVHELDRLTCRQVAEQRFDAARMVADHLATYRALIEGRRTARQAPGTGTPPAVVAGAAGAGSPSDAAGTLMSAHAGPSE